MAAADKRVSLMNEILNSMRLIKMFGWEEPFMEKVKSLRKVEIRELRKASFVGAVMTAISPSMTIIAAIATFITLT